MNEYSQYDSENKEFCNIEGDYVVNLLNEDNYNSQNMNGHDNSAQFLDFDKNPEHHKMGVSHSTSLQQIYQPQFQQQQQGDIQQSHYKQQGQPISYNQHLHTYNNIQDPYQSGQYVQPVQYQQNHMNRPQQMAQNINNTPTQTAQRKRTESLDKKEQQKLIKSDQLTKQQEQILDEHQGLFNYKNNLKNTYINKINNLITEKPKQDEQKQPNVGQPYKVEEDYSTYSNGILKQKQSRDLTMDQIKSYCDDENESQNTNIHQNNSNFKSDQYEKLNQKLARNRESARNSRKRKKVYIELLEQKVNNLTEELEKTRKHLDQSKEYLNKMNSHNQILNGFIFGRQQLFEKLEKQVKSNVDDNELGVLLDSLRLRLGSTGKDRIAAVNHFFKQMLDISIPTHFRYLLWTASEGHDIFCENIEDKLNHLEHKQSWRHELMNYLNLNDKQKKGLGKYQKKFASEKAKLEQKEISNQNLWVALKKKNNNLDDEEDEDYLNSETEYTKKKICSNENQGK